MNGISCTKLESFGRLYMNTHICELESGSKTAACLSPFSLRTQRVALVIIITHDTIAGKDYPTTDEVPFSCSREVLYKLNLKF